MRVLIVHNYYQDPGGEDTVVEQEFKLLRQTEDVAILTYQNRKGIRGLIQTALSPWNIVAARKFKRTVRQFRPDVIHMHNIHYAIGPIAIRAAKRKGIPVVMTLHNYRLLCPSATLFTNGQVFTDSVKRQFPWRAVQLGVHSHSVVKTFWLALTNWMHKKIGTWRTVDQFIALTPFAKRLIESSTLNLRSDQLSVKQNFITSADKRDVQRGGEFLFVGRLSEEKGLHSLLQSFVDTQAALVVAGDGPLRGVVDEYARTNPNIRYLGAVSRSEVSRLLRECTALVFPSIWYEGMPMTLIEALAEGTPVIASDLGAMRTMVSHGRTGILFRSGDPDSLSGAVREWISLDLTTKHAFGKAARREYEDKYTPDSNRQELLTIYHQAIATAKR